MTVTLDLRFRIESCFSQAETAKLILAIAQEEGVDIDDVSDALADLHNAKKIDLLHFASAQHMDLLDGHLFFYVSHIIQKAMPSLTAETASMADAINYLVERGGNDGAANMPFTAFGEWCERNPDAKSQIISLAREDHQGALACLTKVLSVLADHDLAAEFAFDSEGVARLSGITALANIPFSSSAQATETICRLSDISVSEDDLLLRGNILVAICTIFAETTGIDIKEAKDPLSKVICPLSQEITLAILQAIFRQSENISEEAAVYLLDQVDVTYLKDIHPGHVYHALTALLRRNFHDPTIGFIRRWLVELNPDQDDQDTKFLLRDIKKLPAAVQQRVFVEWMLSDDLILQSALLTVYSEHEAPPFEIDTDPLLKALSEEDKKLLCNKTLGFFAVNPLVPAGVIKSVLKNCDDCAAKHIINILKNSLLINYPGNKELIEYLKQDQKSHPRGAALKEALEWADRISSNFGGEVIKELLPPTESRRVNTEIRREWQKEVNRETERQSQLLQLVTRQCLLIGSSTLQYVQDGQDFRPISTHLGQIEVSAQVPSQHVFDPVGFQLESIILRKGVVRE